MMLPQQPTENKVIQDASLSSSFRLNPAASSQHSSISCYFSHVLMIYADGKYK